MVYFVNKSFAPETKMKTSPKWYIRDAGREQNAVSVGCTEGLGGSGQSSALSKVVFTI